MSIENIKPIEFKDFIEKSATIAAGAKIYSDGLQYVDNSLFWEWITNSYKNSQYLNSAVSIKEFLNLHENQIKGIKNVIQGKGMEWDVFREYHPQLININSLPIDTNAPAADITSYNPITGLNTDIQLKTSLVNPSATAKGLFNYPNTTKFGVNQSVYDEAIKQGMPKERFVKIVPDDQIRDTSNQRFQEASTGNIEVGINIKSVLNQVGKGALIGAVLSVGISAISNYRNYKTGQLSYDEFAKELLKDGTKGGLMGGSMASINVGVQWSMVKLGLGAGNPIAIPVLIVISHGLKKIIDPMFKDGAYADILNTMELYEDLGKGWLNFGKMSEELYKSQKTFLATLEISKKKADILNIVSSKFDDNLDNLIEKI